MAYTKLKLSPFEKLSVLFKKCSQNLFKLINNLYRNTYFMYLLYFLKNLCLNNNDNLKLYRYRFYFDLKYLLEIIVYKL